MTETGGPRNNLAVVDLYHHAAGGGRAEKHLGKGLRWQHTANAVQVVAIMGKTVPKPGPRL